MNTNQSLADEIDRVEGILLELYAWGQNSTHIYPNQERINQAKAQILALIESRIPNEKNNVEMWQIEKAHPDIAYTLPDVYEAAHNQAIKDLRANLGLNGENK